ncbi:MAG: TetR/AcrR family transcriptional regulator [Gemmatimonadaceae bacterium]
MSTRTSRHRILASAADRLAAAGAAAVSLQGVAAAAGVSKGLIHYHFRDREALLVETVEWLSEAVAARERRALAGVSPAGAVDALWRWLDAELARGELRVLVELAGAAEPSVREAARAAATTRRRSAAHTVAALFAALSLRPRVPADLIADTLVAFVDGLAVHTALVPDGNPRVAFDVFWLAMLGLAE